MKYKNYIITPVFPPIPTEYRYEFCYIEYYGPGDNRWGVGVTIEDCKEQIDELYN